MISTELIGVKRRDLELLAHQIHHDYHTEQHGSWQDCPRNACRLVRQILDTGLPVVPAAIWGAGVTGQN